MEKEFLLSPQEVAPVRSKNRKIITKIPVPESIEILKEMRRYEPLSMSGQPPVIWDRAENYNVFDKWGNKWLDFSSGVVVANSGHGNAKVKEAVVKMTEKSLLHSYCFPNEMRIALEKKISELVPISDNRVFLLTTGSESTECAIKLARTYGLRKFGQDKITIVSFEDSFHGRTLGSQMAGGSDAGKKWIVNLDKDMRQVPFPNAYKYAWADENAPGYSAQTCFKHFLSSLKEQQTKPNQIAGIMCETFQGGWVQLMPRGFAKLLREFCTKHDILLIFDEIQAGFGRTGKMFGFEHLDVIPDLICCGKGISSSLPISCVAGRSDIMNLYAPNEMTSTHTGNPVCSAAALANISYIQEHRLAERAAQMGEVCKAALEAIRQKYSHVIGRINGVGLVWGVIFTKPGIKDMDHELAHDIVEICMRKGLLMFAPVGKGSTIKVCPPLTIEEDALVEGFQVFDEAVGEACSAQNK